MMSVRKDGLIRRFWDIWTKLLIDLDESEGCIVVEGVHDRDILLELNVASDKIVVIGSRRLDDVVMLITRKFRCVYLFLDRDYRGRYKTIALRRKLIRKNVKVLDVWEQVFSLLSRYGFKSVRKVEEMKKFVGIVRKENFVFTRDIRRLCGL